MATSAAKSPESRIQNTRVHTHTQEERKDSTETMSDRRVTRSMARAMQSDQDQQPSTHGSMKDDVLQVGGGNLPRRRTSSPQPPSPKRRRTARMITDRATTPATVEDKGDDQMGGAAPKIVYRTCPICYVNAAAQDIVKLSCNHEFCRGCINNLFMASVTHEARFPPRCCTDHPVPMSLVRPFLKPETVSLYEFKVPELSTPPEKRVYCSMPTCSAWIPSETITGDVATCTRPACGGRTCVKCKETAHGEEECREDEEMRSLMLLAQENKWKRCPRCQRMVERIEGCDDML